MASVRRIVLGGFLFYVLVVGFLLSTTVAHEYSHYVAHEGWGAAPIQFHESPESARKELVRMDRVEHDGRTFRVENVERTTIVIYKDALVYAATLNMAPLFLYHDGTLGATFMHSDSHETESRIVGGPDAHSDHWTNVMSAPLVLAGIGFVASSILLLLWRAIPARALFVSYASELGNNTHHAQDVGVLGASYGIWAQLIFAFAILLVLAMTQPVKAILHGSKKTVRPAPTSPLYSSYPPTRESLKFHHTVERGPPTPGRAAGAAGYGAPQVSTPHQT